MAKLILNDILDELRDENNRLFNENKMIYKLLQNCRNNLLNLHNIWVNSNQNSNNIGLELKTLIESLDKGFKSNIHSKHDLPESDHKNEDKIVKNKINENQLESYSSDDNNNGNDCDTDIDSDCESNIDPNRQKYLSESNHKNEDKEKTVRNEINDNQLESCSSDDNNNDSDCNTDIDSDYESNIEPNRQKYLNCGSDGCEQTFSSDVNLEKHIRSTHLSEKGFKCQKCDKFFKNKSDLQKHMSCHSRQSFECKKCHKTLSNRSNLRKHLTVFHSVDPIIYKCDKCEFSTKWGHHFRNHLKRIHTTREANIKCDYEGCDKMFREGVNLRAHQKQCHSGVVWRCDWTGCEKVFKVDYNFEEHKSLHLGVFFCARKGCRLEFQDSNGLKQHKKLKHRTNFKQDIPCDWPGCEYLGPNQSKLTDHRRIHLGIKEFKCSFDDCDKTFVLQKGLKAHELTHRKRHLCSWPGCDQKYAINSHLERHLKTHNKT